MMRAIVFTITCLTILASSAVGNTVSQADGPTANTPIEHFLVLMQENHSFDNYFGTYPGANGFSPDTCMPVDPSDPNNTECVKPFHIGEGGVDNFDPDHSSETSKLQYNEGQMNGFVYALNLRNQDGRLAMAHYDEQDLPYYWNIIDQYVLFDNFFSSAQGGSFENHMYWVAATRGQKDGQTLQETLANTPTIFDRLQEKGISWKFYVQNYDPTLNYRTSSEFPANRASQVTWVPLLNIDRFLDNPDLFSHIVDLNEYYADLVNGTLPSVAFIVPSGPSEHPPSSVQSGQRFVKTLIQALMQSHYWDNSVFAWSYDDWGGWYDHVAPPQVDADGYGFRVPTILVSAYARRGYIDHTQLDFTSYLRFIEDNWDLAPLAQRDAQANSIVNALDFTQPPRPAQFLPYERVTDAAKAEPDRRVIYVLYGAIVILSAALFVIATTRFPRRLLRSVSGRGETR
jgi:phospholipase C